MYYIFDDDVHLRMFSFPLYLILPEDRFPKPEHVPERIPGGNTRYVCYLQVHSVGII